MTLACEERTAEAAHGKHTLYVVFHGEMAFYEQCGQVRVLAPELADHVYMAGPWLGERKIPLGARLSLRGVVDDGSGKSDSIGNHSDTWILFSGGSPNSVGAHFEIHMPLPKCIHQGCIFTLTPGAVTVNGKAVNYQKIDIRPVFEYTITDCGAWLEDFNGAFGKGPWASGKISRYGYSSLHIFAEEDVDVTPCEPADPFVLAAGLIGVTGVAFNRNNDEGEPTFPPIEGLYISEQNLTLSERLATVADIGDQLRNRETDLTWNPPARGNKLHGQASCGPVGIQPPSDT